MSRSTLRKFKTAENDSVFLSKDSYFPYEVFSLDRSVPKIFSTRDSIIFSKKEGFIAGPFTDNIFETWVKIVSVDSARKFKVGNIYINPQRTSRDSASVLANNILLSARNGKNFDSLCKKHKDDSNNNYECELGWFFEGSMVSEFENEIL